MIRGLQSLIKRQHEIIEALDVSKNQASSQIDSAQMQGSNEEISRDQSPQIKSDARVAVTV